MTKRRLTGKRLLLITVPFLLLLVLKWLKPIHIYHPSSQHLSPPKVGAADISVLHDRTETDVLRSLAVALKQNPWSCSFRVHYADRESNNVVMAYSRYSRILYPDLDNVQVNGGPNCQYEFHFSGVTEKDIERAVANNLNFESLRDKRNGWKLHEETRGEGDCYIR